MEIIIIALLLLLSVPIVVIIFDVMDKNTVSRKSPIYPLKEWTNIDTDNVKMIKSILSKQDHQRLSDLIERNRRELRSHGSRNSSYDPVTDPNVHATVAAISDSSYDSSSSSNSSSGGD